MKTFATPEDKIQKLDTLHKEIKDKLDGIIHIHPTKKEMKLKQRWWIW